MSIEIINGIPFTKSGFVHLPRNKKGEVRFWIHVYDNGPNGMSTPENLHAMPWPKAVFSVDDLEFLAALARVKPEAFSGYQPMLSGFNVIQRCNAVVSRGTASAVVLDSPSIHSFIAWARLQQLSPVSIQQAKQRADKTIEACSHDASEGQEVSTPERYQDVSLQRLVVSPSARLSRKSA